MQFLSLPVVLYMFLNQSNHHNWFSKLGRMEGIGSLVFFLFNLHWPHTIMFVMKWPRNIFRLLCQLRRQNTPIHTIPLLWMNTSLLTITQTIASKSSWTQRIRSVTTKMPQVSIWLHFCYHKVQVSLCDSQELTWRYTSIFSCFIINKPVTFQ